MNLAWIDSDATKRRINKYGRRRRRSLGSDILGWILCHSLTLLTFFDGSFEESSVPQKDPGIFKRIFRDVQGIFRDG